MDLTTLSSLRACRTRKTVVKRKFLWWCFCGGVFVVFLCFCGGVFVVFLWWGGGGGGVFLFFLWWGGGVFVVVCLWW